MNNPLAIREEMPLAELGNVLVKSGFFADARDAAQAIVKVLAGRELGFGAIASMTGINIIKGRVSLSANLIASAIKRTQRYNYRIKELTNERCTLEFIEGGQAVGVSTFTAEDAKRANLGGDNWQKYPKNMLFARAISNGAKWYCPDVFGGPIYTPDELGAVVDGETGEVVEAQVRDAKPDPGLGETLNPPPSVKPPALPSPKSWDAWHNLVREAQDVGLVVNEPAEDVTLDQLNGMYKELQAGIKAAKAAA